MLTVLDTLPTGLLQRQASELYQILPGPTLIHLPGRRQPPLLVSVLLHGNEITGWLALRKLLQHYQQKALPRALSVLIGNVEAARWGQRHLDHQPDFNRIWTGGDRPEHRMAEQVIAEMKQRGLFASVDVHNNSGRNPHYACVNRTDPAHLHLATLFGRTVLYFTKPEGVQTMAMGHYCPAVVLECGLPDQPHGTDHAYEFLQACLHLSHLPERPVLAQDIDLFHTVAVVKIPHEVNFGFGDLESETCSYDILFPADLDHLNFQELPPHTPLGRINGGFRLDVRDETGEEVSQRYFYTQSDRVLTAVPVMPGMLSLNSRIIRQDCLCYLMERYPLPSTPQPIPA